MLIEHKYFPESSKTPWKRPIFWTFYCTIIVVLVREFGFEISIPWSILSILGTAISLFLGFRTNSAYQRWWEGRKIWGEIINNSRTFARQVIQFGATPNSNLSELRKQIIHRQIAWNWILAYRLRNVGWSTEAEQHLAHENKKDLKSKDHVPNLLLFYQEKDLNALLENNGFDDFYFRKIDSTLKELCDSMGKCERIKATVFPTQYALFTLVFINIFLFLLPMGMAKTLGYFSIPIHIAIGFTFGMIQNIAESMQAPFDNKPNDIPMFSMCRTIERNLLEMLGESHLPESVIEKKGVLM